MEKCRIGLIGLGFIGGFMQGSSMNRPMRSWLQWLT